MPAYARAVRPKRPGAGDGGRARGKDHTGPCRGSRDPPQTGPDGSVQLIESAARVTPGKFDSTRIDVTSTRRGARIAWLEPLSPGISCDYFGEPGTTLASYGLGTRARLIYYTDRLQVPVFGHEDLRRWRTEAGARTLYVLTSERFLSPLLADALVGPWAVIVGRTPPGIGHDDYVLVRLSWPQPPG